MTESFDVHITLRMTADNLVAGGRQISALIEELNAFVNQSPSRLVLKQVQVLYAGAEQQ